MSKMLEAGGGGGGLGWQCNSVGGEVYTTDGIDRPATKCH